MSTTKKQEITTRPCTEPSQAEIAAFRAIQSDPNFTGWKAQQEAVKQVPVIK